jgi:hypothetical protein
MSDNPFFKLAISNGDDPHVYVISYSAKYDDDAFLCLIASKLRQFADSIETMRPHPLVWNEPWVEAVIAEPDPEEVLYPPSVLHEDTVVDHITEWRRKRGLELV